jgi:Na+/H+-dicarboxylate symporter
VEWSATTQLHCFLVAVLASFSAACAPHGALVDTMVYLSVLTMPGSLSLQSRAAPLPVL